MFLTVLLIGMISITGVSNAQELDFRLRNGFANLGRVDESIVRDLGIDFTPFRLGDGYDFIGIYFEVNEVNSKNEIQRWTGRFSSYHGGVAFHTRFGANEDDGGWYMGLKAGFGASTTRAEVIDFKYKDKQKDWNLHSGVTVGYFNPESSFFGRGMLDVVYRQPLSSSKEMFSLTDEFIGVGDSLIWNNQIFNARWTQTIANFFVSSNDNWLMNVDLMLGFGLEHKLVGDLDASVKYFSVGGGLSFFKVPYFQQNMLEIQPEFQIMDHSRFILNFRVNLVPVLFWLWGKETFEFNKTSYVYPDINSLNLIKEGRA